MGTRPVHLAEMVSTVTDKGSPAVGHVGGWYEMLAVLPVYTVLPLLPVTIPVVWIAVNQ
jgi:hypothetical protein